MRSAALEARTPRTVWRIGLDFSTDTCYIMGEGMFFLKLCISSCTRADQGSTRTTLSTPAGVRLLLPTPKSMRRRLPSTSAKEHVKALGH